MDVSHTNGEHEMAPTSAPARTEKADWEIAGEAWSHAAVDWMVFESHSRDALEQIFSQTGVTKGTKMLDIACGTGYAMGVAERRGAEVSGIDASAGLLEIAKRRAPAGEFVAGSMFELPWEDESFDVAISINGIWGGCQDAINEAYRVLKPGGSMGITFWGPGKALDLRDYFIVIGTAAPGEAEELMQLAAIGTPGVAEEMFESAGFVVEERAATSGIIEASSDDDVWRVLRSPGITVAPLAELGEDELRKRVLESVAPFRYEDGSYRIVNEITHMIARKSGVKS